MRAEVCVQKEAGISERELLCLAESCLFLLSSSLERSFSDVTRPHASVKPLLRSDT